MPRRVIQRRYLPVWLMSAVVLGALMVSAWSLRERSQQLDRVLYDQCVSNEQQDAVIVSILLTIPADRRSQVVQDAISTLEPPGESDCTPPKGTEP